MKVESLIEELTTWDFPDRELIPDGYHLAERIKATQPNLEVLVEKVNEIVRAMNNVPRLMIGEGEKQ